MKMLRKRFCSRCRKETYFSKVGELKYDFDPKCGEAFWATGECTGCGESLMMDWYWEILPAVRHRLRDELKK
jgi:hypothetical protein